MVGDGGGWRRPEAGPGNQTAAAPAAGSAGCRQRAARRLGRRQAGALDHLAVSAATSCTPTGFNGTDRFAAEFNATGQALTSPISLSRRGLAAPSEPDEAQAHCAQTYWTLALSADERTRLRGRRHSRCGQPLVLQLPRGEPLQPGEWLGSDDGPALVQVVAATEPLLLVRAADPLELLRAAYHLGNRHVALEVTVSELRLLDDPVLADLLRQRGLQLEQRQAPFLPEGGAYAAVHSHAHTHDHGATAPVRDPHGSA